jgi:hypothetical protein
MLPQDQAFFLPEGRGIGGFLVLLGHRAKPTLA